MGLSMRALLLASLVGTAAAQKEFNGPVHRRQAPYAGPGRNITTIRPSGSPPLPPVQDPHDLPTSTASSSIQETSSLTQDVSRFSYDPSTSETAARSNGSVTLTSTEVGNSQRTTDEGPQFSYEPVSSHAESIRNGTYTTGELLSTSSTVNTALVSAPQRTRPPQCGSSRPHIPSGYPKPSGSVENSAPRVTAPSYGFPSRNHTPHIGACSGAIVNILDASLDWWYSETYTQVESTIILQTNSEEKVTAWSVVSASTTLDITSAIADPTCISSTAFNEDEGETMLQYSCWETPTPVAAATTTVEQTAYKSTNITSGSGAIPNVVTSPTTSAALTVGNSSLSITSGAPIVHFSAYEVVSRVPSKHWDGNVGCALRTKVHNMSHPYSFEYVGREDVNGTEAADEGVVGRVQFAFLRAMGLQDAIPGTFVADPTVVVVVEKVVAAAVPQTRGIELSAPVLETPSATLPSGLSYVETTPTETGTVWVPLSPRVEQTETALDVPTKTQKTTDQARLTAVQGGASAKVSTVISPYKGNLGGSEITLAVPVHAGASQSIVTAVYNGHTITATAIPQGEGGNGGTGGGGNLGLLISAVGSAAQPRPTNALGVLTEALNDLTGTAAATIIGAFPVGSSNGNSGDGQSGGGNPAYDTLGENGDGSNSGGDSDFTGGSTQGASFQNGPGTNGNSGSSGSGGSNGQSGLGGQTGNEPFGNENGEFGSGGIWPTAVITVGSETFTATAIQGHNGQTAFVFNGHTVTAGGSPVTVDGTRLSFPTGGSDIVIGDSTTHLSFTTPNPGAIANIPLITVGSNTYTANAATQFKIGGSVLAPGSEIVVSGTTVSLAAGATEIAVNGNTQQLSAPIITPAPLLTLDGTVYRPNLGSTYNVGSQQLVPGGAAVTISGQTISLLPGGSSVLVDGVRYPVTSGSSAAAYPTITAPPLLTVDGQVYSPDGGSVYVIPGQTLSPGGQITLSGRNGQETISLNSAANALVTIANGVIIISAVAGLIGAASSGAPVLTINGQTYTAISYNAGGSGATYVVDGQTLTPGGIITITGTSGTETKLSLVRAGTALIQIASDTTSTSKISGAYGVLPTNAPILTIGGETFTAINNQPAYLIPDDETLTPGGVETVTINGHTYIVSLSPHATLLEIEEVGSDGEVTSTIWETLFPATHTPTVTTAREAGATEGASPSLTGAVATGTDASSVSGASRSSTSGLLGVCIAAGCFLLAGWVF